MKYPRIFATPDGESRFEDIDIPFEVTPLVPGRPAVEVGPPIPTSAATFLHVGPDWDATWHPTPKHWFCVTLRGEIESTTSDGETRRFGPGSIYFLDDTSGTGHYSRVTGGEDWFGVGVDLVQPEQARNEVEKTLVARLMDEVINQRHFDVLDKLVSPDFVLHSALLGEIRGGEAYKQSVMATLNACPDLHASIDDLLSVEEHKVMVRLTYRGTDTDGFLKGHPATGKSFEFTAIYLWKFGDGRLSELFQESDRLRLMQQLGVLAG
jgi:steroid delta-isomerase-like uncharacterized protein